MIVFIKKKCLLLFLCIFSYISLFSTTMAYYEDMLIDRNGKVKCDLCKVHIMDSDKVIEEHIQDQNHIELFMKRLMIMNNVTLNNDKMYCGICNETVMSDILEHVYNKNHIDSVESITAITEVDGGFLQLPENITNRNSDVYCLICDRCVDFKLGPIKDHLSSLRHRRAKVIAIQPLNGIFSVEGSNDDLYCKICKVYFENYMEIIFKHVDSESEHSKKLGKILKLIDGQNINIEKFLYDPTEDKGMCLKCGLGVSCNVENLYGHIKGKRHCS